MNPPSTLTTSWASFSGRQHSALEWETHYELIKTLYLVRDLKLWQIKDIMAREHGFRATFVFFSPFLSSSFLFFSFLSFFLYIFFIYLYFKFSFLCLPPSNRNKNG